jgi:hypothetical protein
MGDFSDVNVFLEIITLIVLKMAFILITTLNPILNNHHELEKIIWTVPGGSEIFLEKNQNFTQKGNQSYKYSIPAILRSLKKSLPAQHWSRPADLI